MADGFEVVATLPCARLEYNVTNTCYTLIQLPEDLMATVGKTPGRETRGGEAGSI